MSLHGYSYYHSGIYSPNPLTVGYKFYIGSLQYEITSDVEGKQTVKLLGTADDEAISLTIPATVTIEGITYKVTEIASGAFKDHKTLQRIVVGENVTKVGDKAFYNCKALVSVTGGENVVVIGKKVFYGSNALKKNSLEKISIEADNDNTPKTGDNAQTGMYLLLMLGAVLIISAVVFKRRKG